MNISNYQKIFPRSSFHHCTTNYTTKNSNPSSSNSSLSNSSWYAALFTGLFLSYKFLESYNKNKKIKGTSLKDLDDEIGIKEIDFSKEAPLQGPFYHCTKEKNLVKIFEQGAVRISFDGELAIENDLLYAIQKVYFHAFVSIKPEFEGYGRHALVFNDQLKFHADGTPRRHKTYFFCADQWIAFTEDLPVDERCFEKIILQSFAKTSNEREIERKNLEDKISKVAGRSIRVELD